MAPDPHATNFDAEIAEIENRRGKRILFLTLGGVLGLILLLVVVFGARERSRLAEEAARPRFEEVVLGRFVGQASNQAVFAEEQGLNYVEGIGESEIGSSTTFVRAIEYDPAGNPVPAPEGSFFWSLEASDSLPYVIEPVVNPLTGVSPSDYVALDLGTLSLADYNSGGPNDWAPLQEEGEEVSVTGRATREDDTVYLTRGTGRARLQGIEGLSALDSLEVAWATESGAPLSAFGRIASTPREGDNTLFVMTVTAVQPPGDIAGSRSAAPSAAAADTSLPARADTTAIP
ncbi:hypothetical protein BH20GEM1_BH20GEM1_04300 [soil metagenome]